MTEEDRVFLITGASSGIGAATARHAAKAGFRVVLAARSIDKLAALVEELGGPDRALAVQCDVIEFDDQKAMAAAALDAFGRIDVVLANAGVGSTSAGIENGDPANWRDMIRTNFYGCALTAKVCLPELRKRRGHILLLGSRAGRMPLKGSIYGATKWAVTGLGHNLMEELEGTGVRCTLIEPGMVDTPFFETPKPDALRPDDVAASIMYAVSQPPNVSVSEVLVRPTPPTQS
ncbi:SDR family oxidoreductase [Microbaculum marinum]|uniref:SDR family oxidoreductase n=1 Tax=Microbaculum marinum TaxID=1764581 RepID=A0AAW9RXB2_9HYPH